MNEEFTKCFFCDSDCRLYFMNSMPEVKEYHCERCGIYKLCDSPGFYDVPGFYNINVKNRDTIKFKMACLLNERRLKGLGRIMLAGKTAEKREEKDFAIIPLNEILDEFPKKAGDFIVRAVLNLSRLVKQPFEVIIFDFDRIRDRLHLFTKDPLECYALLRELNEQGLIRFDRSTNVFSLTSQCWTMLENWNKLETSSKRTFVAMWFDKSMEDYYKDGFRKAIEEAGYIPVRIDLKDFNNKICDEIISEIKRTKFLIADFSGLRSGVFYEAGFAKGLGREVIFTVRKEDVEKLKEHFDTRQYNHIVYESSEDLRIKLYNRIAATIV